MAFAVLEFPRDPVLVSRKDRIVRRAEPLSVISVGRDQTLLRIREDLIVRRSDLRVRSVDPEQAEDLARSSEARLWIFCFTIELPRLVYLACSVRQCSAHSKFLRLRGPR